MKRVALVTGAGSGIGRDTSLALAQDGFEVVLVGRRIEALEETKCQTPDLSERMHPIPADVSSPESVAALFEQVASRFGRLDLLFNNAGVNIPATRIEDIAWDDWKQVVDINLNGIFLCTQQAVRIMKRQQPRGGRIINNGSIAAHTPRFGNAAYTATKHAVTGLTKNTNLDCRGEDITCGQIDIGNAATEMNQRREDSEPTMATADVARAIVYMANLPLDTNVPFMTVMANEMPYIGRG